MLCCGDVLAYLLYCRGIRKNIFVWYWSLQKWHQNFILLCLCTSIATDFFFFFTPPPLWQEVQPFIIIYHSTCSAHPYKHFLNISCIPRVFSIISVLFFTLWTLHGISFYSVLWNDNKEIFKFQWKLEE